MNKKVIAWTVGSALFAGIVGFWAYSLPDALRHSAAGRADKDLQGIISSFNGKDDSLASDLKQLESDFDKGLMNIRDTVEADGETAAAIADLKEKIMEQDIVNAPAEADAGPDIGANIDTDANTNANTPQR